MEWLDTAQAAHRLGVKPATLYAYVSRGLLQSSRTPDGRASRFQSAEVEQLARRGRPRQSSRSPSLDIQIETSITQIDGHRVSFRGYDAPRLARRVTFEQAAMLLWTGELPERPPHWEGACMESGADASVTRVGDRLRLVAARAAVGADRSTDDATVIDEGRRLIATLVDSLPVMGTPGCPRLVLPDGSTVNRSIAGRLWTRLSPQRARPDLLAMLNASLVLLADHELAASTLAARVAASTRAGVHGVVAAGVGTLSGPLHGGESERCRRLLARMHDEPVQQVVDDALARYGRLPGFGQVLYPAGDPRATALLTALRTAAPSGARRNTSMADLDDLIAVARRRSLPPPNVDLALAALGAVADMPPDAGEAIFTASRIVGWLAHAMEEYRERPLRFRPRAVYIARPSL